MTTSEMIRALDERISALRGARVLLAASQWLRPSRTPRRVRPVESPAPVPVAAPAELSNVTVLPARMPRSRGTRRKQAPVAQATALSAPVPQGPVAVSAASVQAAKAPPAPAPVQSAYDFLRG